MEWKIGMCDIYVILKGISDTKEIKLVQFEMKTKSEC